MSSGVSPAILKMLGWWGGRLPVVVMGAMLTMSVSLAQQAHGQDKRLAAVAQAATATDDPGDPKPITRDNLCSLIDAAAKDHAIPVDFFTRLIWQESAFRVSAVSPKGAQGIAQFMPGTAAERGLADPFDPEQAIPASAHLLADLAGRFGNLGLAAAAYNAGPQRVANWLSGRGGLPGETRHYVRVITGLDAEGWTAPSDEESRDASQEAALWNCLEVVAALGRVRPQMAMRSQQPAPVRAPWGAQVAGDFSQARALARYARVKARHSGAIGAAQPMVVATRNLSRGRAPFYEVRLPAATRGEAEGFCRRMRAAGGSCRVARNQAF